MINKLKEFSYKEKQSTFIVYVYYVESKDDFKTANLEVQNLNKKARHILSVSRIKNNYGIYMTEAKEDKEPVSSMKKVANILEKRDLKDISIFIVRYFGGVKFGASYLDRVYFQLAIKAIDENQRDIKV